MYSEEFGCSAFLIRKSSLFGVITKKYVLISKLVWFSQLDTFCFCFFSFILFKLAHIEFNTYFLIIIYSSIPLMKFILSQDCVLYVYSLLLSSCIQLYTSSQMLMNSLILFYMLCKLSLCLFKNNFTRYRNLCWQSFTLGFWIILLHIILTFKASDENYVIMIFCVTLSSILKHFLLKQ